MKLSKIAITSVLLIGTAGGILAFSLRAPALDKGGCPTASLPPRPVMGLLRLVGIMPTIIPSATVKPSDTGSSLVIEPDPRDQIKCGKTALKMTTDVVFSTPRLANGSAKPLMMDIQMPSGSGAGSGSGRRPLVIYIPGGGFMVAVKEGAPNLRAFVAESGFVVASIQYRTVRDGATYADGLADVKAATRYLRAHADTYGIDPDHVAVWGESAGGYLAAMAGVTGDIRTFDTGENLDRSSKVQAVVDKFGSSDMSKIGADFDATTQQNYAKADGSIALYIDGPGGKGLAHSRIAVNAANPLRYVTASSPPFILFHGDHDTLVSPSQTLMLHDRLRAAGAKSTRYVLHGAGHGDMAFMGDADSGLPWSTNEAMRPIIDFLRETLG